MIITTTIAVMTLIMTIMTQFAPILESFELSPLCKLTLQPCSSRITHNTVHLRTVKDYCAVDLDRVET